MFPLKKPIVSSERKKKREWREGVPKPQNLESAPSKETRQKEQCNRKRVSGLDQDKLINQAKEKDWDWEEEMEEEDGGGFQGFYTYAKQSSRKSVDLPFHNTNNPPHKLTKLFNQILTSDSRIDKKYIWIFIRSKEQ